MKEIDDYELGEIKTHVWIAMQAMSRAFSVSGNESFRELTMKINEAHLQTLNEVNDARSR